VGRLGGGEGWKLRLEGVGEGGGGVGGGGREGQGCGNKDEFGFGAGQRVSGVVGGISKGSRQTLVVHYNRKAP